jgi:hypothetical protein
MSVGQAEPLDENYARLNNEFYETHPWVYFQQRLSHLILVASDRDRYRKIFAKGIRLGSVELTIEVDANSTTYPTPEQSYTAIDAELLLHHSAETLLRFVYAHAEHDPCPWLRMSRMRSAGQFKGWVNNNIVDAHREHVAALCARVFSVDPKSPEDLDAHVEYVRLLAEHFLAADPYNAAKHGMAVKGGSQRRKIVSDKWKLFDRDGMTLTWLALWPRDDAKHPARWTLVSRISSTEATVAMVYITTQLMRGIWIRGRHDHLEEPWDEVFRPHPPAALFNALELRHHVLADWYEPLHYAGEEQTISIESRHFELDSPPASDPPES